MELFESLAKALKPAEHIIEVEFTDIDTREHPTYESTRIKRAWTYAGELSPQAVEKLNADHRNVVDMLNLVWDMDEYVKRHG